MFHEQLRAIFPLIQGLERGQMSAGITPARRINSRHIWRSNATQNRVCGLWDLPTNSVLSLSLEHYQVQLLSTTTYNWMQHQRTRS